MKPKTLTILYWSVTLLFCLPNFLSGVLELFPHQQSFDVMKQLGYPVYFLTIIGIAKILGSVALVQTKFNTIKEWAYAGFTIDFLSASASFYFVQGDTFAILFPLIFLGIMFLSYFLWRTVENIPVKRGK